MVIEESITIKGKSLCKNFEVVNHQDAIEFVESLNNKKYKLNDTDIFKVHALMLQRREKDFAGRYRNSRVRITGANFVPTNALKIDTLFANEYYQSIGTIVQEPPDMLYGQEYVSLLARQNRCL